MTKLLNRFYTLISEGKDKMKKQLRKTSTLKCSNHTYTLDRTGTVVIDEDGNYYSVLTDIEGFLEDVDNL